MEKQKNEFQWTFQKNANSFHFCDFFHQKVPKRHITVHNGMFRDKGTGRGTCGGTKGHVGGHAAGQRDMW